MRPPVAGHMLPIPLTQRKGFYLKMSSETERREFFRIDDEITMQLSPANGSADASIKTLPEEFEILNQLRRLDQDNVQVLRIIQDKHRDIAHYLKVQNEKLDILSRYIANQLKDSFQQEKVNISGNGLKFYSNKNYVLDSDWHLKILLFPDCYGFYCQAKVVNVDKQGDQNEIALEFTTIEQHDQDALIKHITRLQSKRLRQQRLEN